MSTITRYSNVAGTTLVGTTSYAYDYGDRLTAITNYSSTSVTESYYDYAYDSANRVTTETWSSTTATTTLSGTHNTSYDADSQITSADGVAQTYDATGNRTTTGYSTGTGNRLLNDGTYSYTYDNVGNRISKVASGSSPDTWAYAYDQNNRLTSVIEKSNGTTVNFQAMYTYDVAGNLIREDTWSSTAGSATVKHTYDGSTLIADLNSSLVVQTRYFYDPNGNLVAELAGSTVNWAGTDHLGSLRDMFGSTGAITAHVEYTAFGVVTTDTAPAVAGNVLFQGMYQQAVTLNDVTQCRIYDPVTGRWLTTDPSGFNGGSMNLYEAMGNEPTNATDSSGLTPKVPKAPPEKFEDGNPSSDASVKEETAWLILSSRNSGDVYWTVKQEGSLHPYIFRQDTRLVYPVGACKWVGGRNFYFVENDSMGKFTSVVLFNLEFTDKMARENAKAEFDRLMKPVDAAIAEFPKNPNADDKKTAFDNIGAARKTALEAFEKYIEKHATDLIESRGVGGKGVQISGIERDIIPDKMFFNALEYKWTRADNNTLVFRLREAEGMAKWVEYKKIRGNGDVP